MDIDRAIRSALTESIGQDRYAVWFGNRVTLGVDGLQLRVESSNQFALDHVRKTFDATLRDLAGRILGAAAAVEYALRKCDSPLSAASANLDDTPDAGDASAASEERSVSSRDARPEVPAAASRGDTTWRTLESFVVSEGTKIAHTSAQMVAQRPGLYTPLFVYGPIGCGKTHLLEGIRRASARRLQRIVMLSAEKFTSDFLEALRGSGLPSFRRKYRGVELLVVDDVQFFAGKRATLVELQHTVDALLSDGRQLVFSADRSPAELSGLGPELATRLSGGLVCGLTLPDLPARRRILRSMFQRQRITPVEDVIELLAARLTGDARQLQGAVHRLLATAQAWGAPLNVALAEHALSDIFRATCRLVRLSDIELAVCDIFGLEPRALKSQRRTQSVSQPRMLAMWLARKHTRSAFSEIGQFFGGRSHSTVISASHKVATWVRNQSSIRLAQGECHVEDAIRRVEERLRA